MTTRDKRAELLALARKRQATRWSGYTCVGDYHDGVDECDFVSLYSKTAGNVDARILVMLQDWSSDSSLSGPFDEDSATFGHTRNLPTNRNLIRLLKATFDVNLEDVYGTNLFPFIKPGSMSNSILRKDLVRAAHEFALPQIRIVGPRLVICLGLVTFNALRQTCALTRSSNLSSAIGSPFDLDSVRTWCQAHTGVLGKNTRNRGGVDRVSQDWQNMRADLAARALQENAVDRKPPGQAQA